MPNAGSRESGIAYLRAVAQTPEDREGPASSEFHTLAGETGLRWIPPCRTGNFQGTLHSDQAILAGLSWSSPIAWKLLICRDF